MYHFYQFKKLPPERQVEQLSLHGISMDLFYDKEAAEAVLFAYRDFYVELLVAKHTDDILAISCFNNGRKLAPYLQQINISEITTLLSCSK